MLSHGSDFDYGTAGRFGMIGCSLVVVLFVLDPNLVRGPEVVFPSLLGCLRCVGCLVS